MTTHAIAPHTRIDNSIIDTLPAQLGIYGLGIYVAIKRYLNTITGDCFPSYKTLAKKLHIDRSTVIRYVKKMKELNIISPEWRFKEDGSHTSNQYNFHGREITGSSKKTGKTVQIDPGTQICVPGGSGTKPLPVVAEDNHPGSPLPPKQSEPNKKQRTINDVDFIPTERQRNCTHPVTEVVYLSAGIVVCHHCYSLLPDPCTMQEEKTPTVEIVAA
jgi:GntR family transcriptional regulator